MDLNTEYLGLKLRSPLVSGAGPLVDDLSMVRRLDDAGAGAIVMHSLFEEQIVGEQLATYSATETPKEMYGEAQSYLPEPDEFHLGPDAYLEQVRKIKAAVSAPVIASLNGETEGGWLKYAKLIADAGADALELNIYDLPSDPSLDSASVEQRMVNLVAEVRQSLDIPVAVKLAPFYTALANLAARLRDAGADGLVLFNRLYQPDIDPEELELIRVNPIGLGDLPLRLRWLGLLHDKVGCDLAATGGITTANDAVKAIMAGADVVQIVSALLLHGPEYLADVRRSLVAWMEEHEYESVAQMRGAMSRDRCPDPTAYDRANYMRTLLSWRL